MSEDIEVIKQVRTSELEINFIDSGDSINGIELYPFTAGRKILCKKLGNELMTGRSLTEMNDPDYAVLEFLYLHTLDDKAAVKAVRDKDKWAESVMEFACGCSAGLDKECALVISILNKANLGNVEVEQKPTTGSPSDTPNEPPN